jgi:hypothetical protein
LRFRDNVVPDFSLGSSKERRRAGPGRVTGSGQPALERARSRCFSPSAIPFRWRPATALQSIGGVGRGWFTACRRRRTDVAIVFQISNPIPADALWGAVVRGQPPGLAWFRAIVGLSERQEDGGRWASPRARRRLDVADPPAGVA